MGMLRRYRAWNSVAKSWDFFCDSSEKHASEVLSRFDRWTGQLTANAGSGKRLPRQLMLESLEVRVLPTTWLAALANLHGKWEGAVLDYSSQYSSTDRSTAQAVGTSNTWNYGDQLIGWSATECGGSRFISLGFDAAGPANGLIFLETNFNGFVTQIDLF